MDIVDLVAKIIIGLICLYVLAKLVFSIRMVPTQTAIIVERLGRYSRTLQPGFHILLPFIERSAFTLDLREETIAVEPQECFTLDNVKVEVDGIIYISIDDPVKASYGITDYRYAAIQLAQTTTRSVIGTIELDKTFEERELVSARVVEVLDEVADSWGIRVHRYEVKNIVPPNTVRDAMEKQMTAEREKRAMLATAEGKRQSSINDSEGVMTEVINHSEGEKQKRINEAEGKAKEIEALAKATADSISKVAVALTQEHGEDAINMRLAQQYIKSMGNLAHDTKDVMVPLDLGDFPQIMAKLGLKTKKLT
ncbi:MAG: paraslipin [Planctomycetes bacterium]|nr:paraslipin [Planctomycetota bacterium]